MGSRGAVPLGYVHGPAAATAATGLAVARVPDPLRMILVEGISDQIAVDTLARLGGRDLAAERVAVVPIGGAHAVRRFVNEHRGRPMVALADADEVALFRRELSADAIFVCHADLEDELIRAVGVAHVLRVLDAEHDRRRFATMQKQSAWRGRPVEAQLRRFLGSGARRKLRYAQLLTAAAVELGRVPAPLEGVLRAAQ
jgi:hypothetical protein